MAKDWRRSNFREQLEMSTLIAESMWPIVRPLLLFTLASFLLLAADLLGHPLPKAAVIALFLCLYYFEIVRRLRGRVGKRVVFGKTFPVKRAGLGHSFLFIGLVTLAMIVGLEFRDTFGIYLFIAAWLAVAAVFVVAAYRLTRLAFALVVAIARLLYSWHNARHGRP